MSLRGENLDRGQYPFQPIHIRSSQSLWDKALVNEDTLLWTLCCPWCFLGCANWETFVADTKCFWTKSETFFVSRTQNLCPQQMLRARANGETFVSATMCPQQCVLVCQGLKNPFPAVAFLNHSAESPVIPSIHFMTDLTFPYTP